MDMVLLNDLRVQVNSQARFVTKSHLGMLVHFQDMIDQIPYERMSWAYNVSQSAVGDGCKIMDASCTTTADPQMQGGSYGDASGIGHVNDLCFLTKGDLENVGVKGKNVDRVLNSIASGKQRSLENLIFALGIPEVGLGTPRTLANHFSSLDALSKGGTLGSRTDTGYRP